MRVVIFVAFLTGCVTVDKNHWAWCSEECGPQGGLMSAGFQIGEVSCECEDGSLIIHDKVPFQHYPPEVYEEYDEDSFPEY